MKAVESQGTQTQMSTGKIRAVFCLMLVPKHGALDCYIMTGWLQTFSVRTNFQHFLLSTAGLNSSALCFKSAAQTELRATTPGPHRLESLFRVTSFPSLPFTHLQLHSVVITRHRNKLTPFVGHLGNLYTHYWDVHHSLLPNFYFFFFPFFW